MRNLIVLYESYQEVVEMDDETEGMEDNLVVVNISADMTREEVMVSILKEISQNWPFT